MKFAPDYDVEFQLVFTDSEPGPKRFGYDMFGEALESMKRLNRPSYIREVGRDHFANKAIDRIRAVMA